jgi:2-dehydrotetronate isomerase
MTKLSANLGFMWTDLPLLARIEAAARAGFKAVELHFPYDFDPGEVRRVCTTNGVKLLGINTPVGATPAERGGLQAIPGREAEALANIDKAFDFAHAAGGTAVHVMAGIVAPEQQTAARSTFLAALRHAVGRAEETGLTVLLEPLNPRDMPGYFYSRVEDARALIEAIGSPRLKLMFDVYHVGVSQGDVLTRLRANLPIIGHVQVAAVPSRAEPDEGEINFHTIFSELDALGYAGWIGCEYKPRSTTDAGLAWVQALGLRLGD